jgi:hypothetical protein
MAQLDRVRLGAGAVLDFDADRATACAERSGLPLSEERTQKAIEAFGQLAQVFTKEPRCVNCHGGVKPFAPDGDGHVGGAIAAIRTSGDQIDLNATNAQCQLCHSGLPGWKLAPANDVFQGQTAVQICKNQKFVFGRLLKTGPPGFANHIETDVGIADFIGNAFFGNRGLDFNGIDQYQRLTGKNFRYSGLQAPSGAFFRGDDYNPSFRLTSLR